MRAARSSGTAIGVACACACAAFACSRTSNDESRARQSASDPSVHALALPEPPFELPGDSGTPGRALTQAMCLTCHSARYMANQPAFSRKTWSAEVDKMKRSYGAPIPDDKTKEIVDYLVATNGRED